MKKMCLLMLFLGSFFFSQEYILYQFPLRSDFYEGGSVAFYKDFHNAMKEHHIKPCENKNELYLLQLAIYPDATIKIVKDENEAQNSQNKCTKETTKEVLKYLTKWKPAQEEGQKYAAVKNDILIYLDDLYDQYTKDYDPQKLVTSPEYKGGISAFREDAANAIRFEFFQGREDFEVIIQFTINQNGKMENVSLLKESSNESLNFIFTEDIKSLQKKWKPASFHGISIPYSFIFPLRYRYEVRYNNN